MPGLIRSLVLNEAPAVYSVRKEDEDSLTLFNGCSITLNTFTERMRYMGFDPEMVVNTIARLQEGCIWHLTLTPSQIKVIEG